MSENKTILTEMEFDLVMDREIEKKHYISPGGYELNGKPYDFFTYSGKIDTDDRKRLHVNVYDPDLDSFEVPVFKSDLEGEFSEFFIYTGEYDDPEIMPVKVENLMFYWSDHTETKADERLLESANAVLPTS